MKESGLRIERHYSKRLFMFSFKNSFQYSPRDTYTDIHIYTQRDISLNIHKSLQQPHAIILILAVQLKPGKAKINHLHLLAHILQYPSYSLILPSPGHYKLKKDVL